MKKLTAAMLLSCLMAGSAFAAVAEPDAQNYTGSYAMADGRTLTITEHDGQLHARITSRNVAARNARFSAARDVLLKETGPDQFASVSTPLRVSFAQGARGEMAQVTLSDQSESMMASR